MSTPPRAPGPLYKPYEKLVKISILGAEFEVPAGNILLRAFQYLAPETVRIPLIIHVPPSLRTGRVWDTDAVALSTDVTPTLYDLLGLRLSDPSGLLGRSLMPPGAAGLPRRPDTFLVQSSYSRVFGLLDGHGEWMYTADVNREKEDFYDLAGGSSYPKALVPADRLKYRKRLLERMEEVNRLYGPRRPPRSVSQ